MVRYSIQRSTPKDAGSKEDTALMSTLLALDVAILPPPNVRSRAVRLSAALPADQSQGLRLDADRLPHITLTQQFVRTEELDAIFTRLDEALRGQPPMTLQVIGGGKGASSVWMAVERATAISLLHARLMDALHSFEQPGGGAAAFVEGDAREGDVAWVTGYRQTSSFVAYTPHITLGHAAEPPRLDPFTFEATTVAACHLGRFCTCRQILRSWELR
jgi:2'-5' RNA ligase